MHIGILLFDDVEVLDACGPFEVFSVARRLQLQDGADHPLAVTLVSAYSDRVSVTARGGLRLTADCTIDDSPDFELLVVPGGVTETVEKDEHLIAWLSDRAQTPTIASVCTGAFLLAEARLVTGGQVTTHWEDQDELADRYPWLDVVDGPRWVRNGTVFTSAGISAGLDLALHLTGLIDEDLPRRVARQMDYAWQATPAT